MSGALRTVAKVAGIVATIATIAGHPEIALVASAVAATASPAATVRSIPPRRPVPMTAISLFTDDKAAILIADGATYDASTGTIFALGPKAFAFPAARVAIAMQGWGIPSSMAEHVHALSRLPQRELLTALPGMLAGYRMCAALEGITPLLSTRLWVAAFDPAQGPRMFTVQSGPMPDGEGVTYVLEPSDGGSTGLEGDCWPEILPSGYVDDLKEDGRRILDAQRRASFDHLPGGCAVDGECGAYIVDQIGIRYLPIVRYPGRVGERSDPSRPGTRLS